MPDYRNEPTASIADPKLDPAERLPYQAPKLVRLDAGDTQLGVGHNSDGTFSSVS